MCRITMHHRNLSAFFMGITIISANALEQSANVANFKRVSSIKEQKRNDEKWKQTVRSVCR